MADVLRALGYRVMPPAEEGGVHTFSVKSRFMREREEQRERHDEQRVRPNERQFFADAARRDKPRDGQGRNEPPRSPQQRSGKPEGEAAAPPRGPQHQERGREERGREERRGNRPPRRDPGGPALRLYATTEKKGDVADSPFAKLLELKLGGKK